MRLLLIGPGPPFRGGISSTTSALAAALRQAGHQVFYLLPARQYPSFFYPGGNDRVSGQSREIEGSERIYAPLEPWTWPRTIRRARDFRADWWITPYWTWVWAPFQLALLSARGTIPVASVVHNPVDHEAGLLKRVAARMVLKRCRVLFTHAGILAGELKKSYPGREVGFHLLPPPPLPSRLPDREEQRTALGLEGKEKLALFCGLIRPYKGVDCLLDAFGALPDASPWRLVIAGEAWGDLEHELEARADRLGFGGRVRFFFGWQDDERVENLLAAADILVLPYRSASQSAVAPLALSRGVPVLASRVGGLSEIIRDEINGRLVPPGRAGAITAVLEELDDENLEKIRRGAAESIGSLGIPTRKNS